MCFDDPDHLLDRQADDILKRPLDPLDQTALILLGRVASRLVQRVDFQEIGSDTHCIELAKRNTG